LILLQEVSLLAWTPWIKIVPLDTDDSSVQRLYRRTGEASKNGNPPDLVRLTGATSEVSGLLFDLSRAVHTNAVGLTLREQSMVALIVAVYNGCVH
jgi:hypothetical protein